MPQNPIDTDRQDEQILPLKDFSAGMQEKSTEFQQKPNELDKAYNSRFDRIGGVRKASGYTSYTTAPLTSTTSTSTSTSTTTTSTSSTTSTSTTTTTSTTTS